MAKKVTCIPATAMLFGTAAAQAIIKRRVAAYARVSTDSEEQFTSFEAQNQYYKDFIENHADWDFVKVYSDEGISGLSTKQRVGFQEMIADALAGKIDLIVTKSVSRFARNTVDTLTTIRDLKAHNVEVFFEKENIYTFDGKGELLITIMGSLAQEESRSISQNVTWGHRRSFENGNVHLPYGRFLGYDKGKNGPVTNKEEAAIVELIYRLFLDGKTKSGIAKELMARNIPSPSGKATWTTSTVMSILTNEKYKGAALLQKTFTTDFLTKKAKKNEGEVPQYYVEESHEAIIHPEVWEMVQIEIARRKNLGMKYSGTNPLSSKLICEDCGYFYGRKLWHSTDKYRSYVWRCNNKFNGEKCKTPSFRENDIQNAFIRAYNTLVGDLDRVVDDCKLMYQAVTDTEQLDKKIHILDEKITEHVDNIQFLIRQNACHEISNDEFNEKYNKTSANQKKLALKLSKLTEERDSKRQKGLQIKTYISNLVSNNAALTEWNASLFTMMVEKVKVKESGILRFYFFGGQTIEVDVPVVGK